MACQSVSRREMRLLLRTGANPMERIMSLSCLESSTVPSPSESNLYLVDHISLLRDSFWTLTRRELVSASLSPREAAKIIFHAPFVVLSHSSAQDPILTY